MKLVLGEDYADEPKRLQALEKGLPMKGDPCEMFLLHSILYYKFNTGLVSDAVFDAHCRWMRHHAAEIHSRYEKHVVIGDLRCNGYHGKWSALPQELFDKAERMLAEAGW